MIKRIFGRSRGRARQIKNLRRGSKLAKDAKRSGAKAISEAVADGAERDYSFVNEQRAVHSVKRGFGFQEFSEPDALDNSGLNATYVHELRKRTNAFFSTGLEIPSLDEVFYETVEFHYLQKTYGNVSINGAGFLQATEVFSNTASKNDAHIAIWHPFYISIVLLVAYLAAPFAQVAFANEIASFGVDSNWLIYGLLTTIAIIMLLVYLFIYLVTYKNSQRLTIAHYSAYAQKISNFNALQFSQLKVDYQNVENQHELNQERDEIISLASDYAVALNWAMFESLLFQNTLRCTLFRYRRDASWWRFIGAFLIIVMLGFGIGGYLFVAPYNQYNQQEMWVGISIFAALLILVLIVQQLLTRNIEGHAERDLRFNNFDLFHSIGFLEHISEIAKTEKMKYILMRDRLGGGAMG